MNLLAQSEEYSRVCSDLAADQMLPSEKPRLRSKSAAVKQKLRLLFKAMFRKYKRK